MHEILKLLSCCYFLRASSIPSPAAAAAAAAVWMAVRT
jgi:hypothetical protein